MQSVIESLKGDHLAGLENAFLEHFPDRAKLKDKNKVKSNLSPPKKVKKIDPNNQIRVGRERGLLVLHLV